LNEYTNPLTPELRALDGINPVDPAFKDALSGGVTGVMIAPGSANVLGGMTTFLKTCSGNLKEKTVIAESGLKAAFGENPKRVYAEQKKMPRTRMATAALLRQALKGAQDYSLKKKKDFDLGKENILRVLEGEIPLRAHAHRADDILTVLRIAEEFRIKKLVIEHCTEGFMIIPELLEAGAMAASGPFLVNRAKVEMAHKSYRTPGLLAEAGIVTALITDHPVIPIQYTILNAALAVKEGMSREAALRAITLDAAKINGLEERIGSIRPGKDADVVLWSDDPLLLTSKVEAVFVNGERETV